MELIDFFDFANTKGKSYIRVLPEIIERKKESLVGTEEIKPFLNEIRSCEEFSECTVEPIDNPDMVLLDNGTLRRLQYLKINKHQKFKGKCYLYSLMLTPMIYDPITFETHRGIIVSGFFDLGESLTHSRTCN